MSDSRRSAALVADTIDHVELFVPDQYEAAAWYERVLGLSIVPEFEHWAATGPLMVATRSGVTKLALFAGTPIDAPAEAAFRRVAFVATGEAFVGFLAALDDVALTGMSGRRLGATDVIDHDGAFSIYFSDPWGHRLEVTTYELEPVRDFLTGEATTEA